MLHKLQQGSVSWFEDDMIRENRNVLHKFNYVKRFL